MVDRMPNSADLFEMRRLEDLSNTIFGVAMTLLAYRFPTGQFLDGAPVWATIWRVYQSQIVALLLSFVVAGVFWVSPQRPRVYEPTRTTPLPSPTSSSLPLWLRSPSRAVAARPLGSAARLSCSTPATRL